MPRKNVFRPDKWQWNWAMVWFEIALVALGVLLVITGMSAPLSYVLWVFAFILFVGTAYVAEPEPGQEERSE